MEMKQVERSSVQIPNRRVARVPPTAPWRQGTVTRPSGPPRGHGCEPQIKGYFNLSYLNIIYLGISPRIFVQTFLNSLARSRYSRDISWILILLRKAAARAFLPRVLVSVVKKKKFRGLTNEDRRRVIPVVCFFFCFFVFRLFRSLYIFGMSG